MEKRNTEKHKVDVTYANQNIPSMFNIPLFELPISNYSLQLDIEYIINIKQCSDYCTSSVVDYSGKRVQKHQELVKECNVIEHVL